MGRCWQKKGWEIRKLGEVVDLLMGQAPSSKDTNFNGTGTPFVKVGEFGNDRPVIREWITNPLRLASRTDVLLCVVVGRKGTLGKVFYLESDFWPHDTTLWVKDFKGNDTRFVYYLLKGLDVKKLDSGAANPALNRNQVHPIKVSWPPYDQQKALVMTLDALSADTSRLAAIYERKLAALEELKKSLLAREFAGEL